jgi:hypothetical protein
VISSLSKHSRYTGTLSEFRTQYRELLTLKAERWLAATIHADIWPLLVKTGVLEEGTPVVSMAGAVDDEGFPWTCGQAGSRQLHGERGVSRDDWANVIEFVPVPSNHVPGDLAIVSGDEAIFRRSLEHPRKHIAS